MQGLRPAGSSIAAEGVAAISEKDAAVPKRESHGLLRMIVEAAGLSTACFVLALIFGGNGPGEAAVAAVAVAGSPNPSGSRPLHAELGALASAVRMAAGGLRGQDSPGSRRTAA